MPSPQELFLMLIEATMDVRTALNLTNFLLTALLALELGTLLGKAWRWYRDRPAYRRVRSKYQLPPRFDSDQW